MILLDGTIVYSASDLAAAARCEFALLRAFDAQLGWGPPSEADDDLLVRTARLGGEHEQRYLDELRAEVGETPTIIDRPAYTWAGLTAAAEATEEAVARRSPVIVQAAMFDGRFVGFADFLVLEEGGYRLRDTKLARSVKVTALLQLAAYADGLIAAGTPVLHDVELVLGNGVVTPYPVHELLPVYRARRRDLQALLDGHYAGGLAVRWGHESVRACLRCPECEVELQARNDVLLVAGMRTTQRARLMDAGITTISQLAEHSGSIPGLSGNTSDRLRSQARLQMIEPVDGIPAYEVVDSDALSALPPPSPGDIFFDFEGDPLWTDDGRSWGLEYLFGILGADDQFEPIWAHDRLQERRGLRRFLDLVAERRQQYPDLHIYHYASYERTALLRLAGQYGVGEEEVDDLLRDSILVDLFTVVRNSIRVGTSSYSLKALEPLYMGHEIRTGDVTTATDSIVMYDKYCTLISEHQAAEAAAVLAEIVDYNFRDCRSTRRLRDWLLIRAREHGVTYREPPAPKAKEYDPIDEDETARALMAFAGDELKERTADQQAVAMIAAARSFHKREDKPYWWGHFQRMNNAVDEWADTAGVFLVEDAQIEEEWVEPTGLKRKPRRKLRLHGTLESGELSLGAATAIYDSPAPATLDHYPNGRACKPVKIDWIDNPAEPSEIVLTETSGGNDGVTHHQLPFALTPAGPFKTKYLRQSINSVAAEVKSALPHLPSTACMDILARRPPRTASAQPLPTFGNDIDNITAALLDLDHSYLAIHGPPGSGKSYVAARVIARLVNNHGWRIGVVAQAHSVVEELLDGIVDAGVDPQKVAKKVKTSAKPRPRQWQAIDADRYPDFIASGSCVIGGTAWDFSNPGRVPPGSLDLLVIEEAGQFCLANTIAVSNAARNLLLLGDPQQLPQVSQGTHAEPVERSALGWLVDGAPTLDPALGYFLARSWRMHPAVCGPVSRLSYGGRLTSVREVTTARNLESCRPGVFEFKVDHDENSTDSIEEAQRVVAEISSLLGLQWTDEKGSRPLQQGDVLVVAAYNAQVRMIRRELAKAGLRDVRVGTVDKFQGKQAPVVFFSLAASSIDDVPRGISFLLNRNRVNVAISRAKYVSYIVRSTRLTDYLPPSPAGLTELGAFLGLTDHQSDEELASDGQ